MRNLKQNSQRAGTPYVTSTESHLRSWVKSVTWRVIGIVILGGISYMITDNWSKTVGITVIFHTIRLVLYYFHERAWEHIGWGKAKHPLSYLPVKEDLTPQDHDVIQNLLEERDYLDRSHDYQI